LDPSCIVDFETDAELIIVVEKDTIFNLLISNPEINEDIGAKVMVITGKGYPDYSTKRLVHLLTRYKGIPAVFLCDMNSFGVDIFTTYAFGSIANIHESHVLATPSLLWLGPFLEDFTNPDLPILEHLGLPLPDPMIELKSVKNTCIDKTKGKNILCMFENQAQTDQTIPQSKSQTTESTQAFSCPNSEFINQDDCQIGDNDRPSYQVNADGRFFIPQFSIQKVIESLRGVKHKMELDEVTKLHPKFLEKYVQSCITQIFE